MFSVPQDGKEKQMETGGAVLHLGGAVPGAKAPVRVTEANHHLNAGEYVA
jgi:hypothetical protein